MIRRVTVLGAGSMGAQIAAHAANAGLSVLLLDLTKDQVQTAIKGIEKSSPPALFVPEKIRQIEIGSFASDLGRVQDADWIIEAIVEDPAAKSQLMEKVDAARRHG